MNFRTDLAIEMREVNDSNDDGLETQEYKKDNYNITEIKVVNSKGEEKLGKPIGTYITIEAELTYGANVDQQLADIISEQLKKLLPEGKVLVCGIGNEEITPDALGPKAATQIFATRHISAELANSIGLGSLRCVSAITPGVLGQTGMETAEVIKGVTEKISPDVVIAIDALASRKLDRLGCTVQISDTGIIPGGGVGNSRSELSKNTLGVPVISVGVPTVVDANTLVNDISQTEREYKDAKDMLVTPKEIDLLTDRCARLISHSINCALQPHLEPDDLLMLTTA